MTEKEKEFYRRLKTDIVHHFREVIEKFDLQLIHEINSSTAELRNKAGQTLIKIEFNPYQGVVARFISPTETPLINPRLDVYLTIRYQTDKDASKPDLNNILLPADQGTEGELINQLKFISASLLLYGTPIINGEISAERMQRENQAYLKTKL